MSHCFVKFLFITPFSKSSYLLCISFILSLFQALAVGQLFGEELYTIMSNAGMLIFIITILLVMAEVDKDMVATHDVACFLVSVAQKGDQTRIVELATFYEEEKRPEDEETGPVSLTGCDTNGIRNDAAIPTDQGAEASSVSREVDRAEGGTISQEALSKSLGVSSIIDEDIDKENGSAQFINHDEENGPAVLVETEMEENANAVASPPDQSVEAPQFANVDEEHGPAIVAGNEVKESASKVYVGANENGDAIIDNPDESITHSSQKVGRSKFNPYVQ